MNRKIISSIVTITILLCFPLTSYGQQIRKVNLDYLSEYINRGDINGLNQVCDSITASKNIQVGFTYSELIEKSKSEFLKGNRNEAIGHAFASTKIFSKSAECMANLGLILSWNNLNEDAMQYFTKALELDPENRLAQYQLSRIKGMEYDKEYETTIQKLPDSLVIGLKGTYIGQKEPGDKPELFAPGIVSTAGSIEFGCTFSPDGKEFYFTRRSEESRRNVILVSYFTKEGWSPPDTAWFSNSYSDFEPHYSLFGDRIYFGSIRAPKKGQRPISGIWYVERNGEAWSKPIFLSPGMYASMSKDSLMYLSNISGRADEGISAFNPYTLSKPLLLNNVVNIPVSGQHPCIASDGSYIIFDSHRKAYLGGESDLYIAFKDNNGTFSQVSSLSRKINSPGADFGASLTYDGKYLFFTRHRDIYWVNTELLKSIE